MTDLDYAKVTGRLALTVGDSVDVGEDPDTIWCDEGTVRIKPLNTYTKVAGGTPVPFTAGHAVIDCTVDTEGYITWNGQRQVYVVDLTSPKVNPQIGAGLATHEVTFLDVKADGTPVAFEKMQVRLTLLGPEGDGENDLTIVSPVPSGSATPIIVGPQGTGIADAEVNGAGNLLLTLTDATVVDAGVLPVGPGGSDAGVAGYITTPGTATGTALSATFALPLANAATSPLAFGPPQKMGPILSPGPSTYDVWKVEGLTPWFDPHYGLHCALYAGYTNDVPAVASLCWATSPDGITWTKQGIALNGTGVNNDPDEGGVTGGSIYIVGNLRVCLYIGLTETGYEGGAKTVCVATQPADGPLTLGGWTRHGAILTPSGASSGASLWRSAAVWKANLVQRPEGGWYIFVNATDNASAETIGLAENTSGDITNPAAWVFRDDLSPVWANIPSVTGITGDPSIIKTAGGYLACIYRFTGSSAYDEYWATTDADFPLGWTQLFGGPAVSPGAAGTFDAKFAHKGVIYVIGDRLFHYYTATDIDGVDTETRQVGLAIHSVPRAVPSRVHDSWTSPGGSSNVSSAVSDTWGLSVGSIGSVTVNAKAGDVIMCGVSAVASSEATELRTTMFTLNAGGAYLNNIGATGHGVSGWWAPTGAYVPFGGSFPYVVQAADVIDGRVTLTLAFKSETATARIILNNVADPLTYWATNLSA